MADESKPHVVVERELMPPVEREESEAATPSPIPVDMPSPAVPPKDAAAAYVESEIERRVAARNKAFAENLTADNKRLLDNAINELKARLEPPTNDAIQQMLNQEYITFKIKFPVDGEEREFTLEELPQSVEKKFYRVIKDRMIPLAQEIGSVNMSLLDGGDIAKKILAVANTVEPLMDVMCACAAIALNPRNKNEGITDKWVQENVSSSRILSIVNAQAQCNRMRDFFSILSRGMKSLT